MRKFGIGLLVISFVPWIAAIAVPFLALPLAQKATIAAILFGVAEVMFWVGVLIVGKEVADRYRFSFKSWFNPRYVWRKVRRIGRR
jgi:hypothetical protein